MATTNNLSSSSSSGTSPEPSWPTTPPRRPLPLRSATGIGQGNSMSNPRARHRRAASSSSILHASGSSSPASPRFSQLLTTVLGSPFLTTTDLPFTRSPDTEDATGEWGQERASSPAPSVDYSVIDMDPNDTANNSCTNPSIPGSFPLSRRSTRHWGHHHHHTNTTHARSFSTSMASMSLPRNYDFSHDFHDTIDPSRPISSIQSTFKALIPRIWDALSSPGRVISAALPFNEDEDETEENPTASSPSPTRPSSPLSTSWIHAPDLTAEFSRRTPSMFWNARNQSNKGKARATTFSRSSSGSSTTTEGETGMEYGDMDALDDDEGELIDDEGCFIDVRVMTGIDILSLLPPELALHILLLLSSSSPTTPSRTTSAALQPLTHHTESLHALLSCRSVSHTWRRLASDNAVWRALFQSRWDTDLSRGLSSTENGRGRRPLGETWDFDWGEDRPRFWEAKRPHPLRTPSAYLQRPATSRTNTQNAPLPRPRSIFLCPRRISYINTKDTKETHGKNALSSSPLQLDWRVLYRERLELERRWMGVATSSTSPPSSSSTIQVSSGGVERVDDVSLDDLVESKENVRPFEPSIRNLAGHSDSVYCLEFDSQRIMTGSRDRTIKVWDLKTGRLISTFRGLHRGSVLCLKFERDWDLPSSSSPSPTPTSSSSRYIGNRKGMLVSGSSDCTVCVWELESGVTHGHEGEWKEGREVTAEVRTILRGHEGGVLDLRMDERWIVSCSKDTSIRIWDKDTLDCVRTLRGHEGPVNAIGLQGDKIVSASGDGKMILWDLVSGERIRTFEGHERGLACIEFKDNLIVSGSNDCKIKVWDPWTGECIRTLAGHEALVRALCFDPRTARLVSVSYDRTVKVWDLRSGKLVREFKHIHTSHIFDVKFDVSRIVTTSHDHQIIELDFSEGLDTSLFV